MKRAGSVAALAACSLLAVIGFKGALVAAARRRRRAAPGALRHRPGAGAAAPDPRRSGPHPVDSDANDRGPRRGWSAELQALGLDPARHRRFHLQRRRNRPDHLLRPDPQRRRDDRPGRGPACAARVALRFDADRAGRRATTASGSPRCWRWPPCSSDRPLKRPVTFLFNEGEETGLIGARAFLERDPVAAGSTA